MSAIHSIAGARNSGGRACGKRVRLLLAAPIGLALMLFGWVGRAWATHPVHALSLAVAPPDHALPLAAAALDQPIALAVAAQPLGESLRALAKQANLQILFDSALVSGRSAGALHGTMSARAALNELLRGTGLEAHEQAPGVIVIRSGRPRSMNGGRRG
jgi:hypothetical protein